MSLLLVYIMKLSISLAAVWLFYHFILRKLTFYHHNRWFLLAYTLLSFVVPFIDISPVLEEHEWGKSQLVSWVPVMHTSAPAGLPGQPAPAFSISDAISLVLFSGMLLMCFRLGVQFLSFRRMRKKAVLLTGDKVKLYQVPGNIIPFSFGNSVFINRELHTAEELQEIIRHEFVHIRQRHSLDILWSECLCLVNWFNPFAWLLRKAIRQNLEFIADNKVLQHGMDRKAYQYLLLKVTGNHQYSIAAPFNFSSLKKRIAMMNRTKSARRHLIRFLFLLPLLVVGLLAFRKKYKAGEAGEGLYAKFASIVYDRHSGTPLAGVLVTDLKSGETATSDENGYFEMKFPIQGRREVEFNLRKEGYSAFRSRHVFDDRFTKEPIGVVSLWEMEKGDPGTECRTCMPLTFLDQATNPGLGIKEALEIYRKRRSGELAIPPGDFISPGQAMISDTIPQPVNEKGYHLSITDLKGNCMVEIKDAKGTLLKKVLLTDWNKTPDKFISLYGELPPPPPPVPGTPAEPQSTVMQDFLERNPTVKEAGWVYNKDNTAAILHLNLNNGKVERYDLRDAAQRKTAEDKYGLLPLEQYAEIAVVGQPLIPVPADASALVEHPLPADVSLAPLPPAPVKLPDHVQMINIQNGKATVTRKDGKKEYYDLEKPAEKKEFEKKYGTPPATPAPAGGTTSYRAEFDYKDNKVTVKKDGKKEVYDLSDPVQRTEFRTIYDRPVIVPDNAAGLKGVAVTGYPIKASAPLEGITVLDKPVQATETVHLKGHKESPVPVKAAVPGTTTLAGVQVQEVKLAGLTTSSAPLSVAGELSEVRVAGNPISPGSKTYNSDKDRQVEGQQPSPAILEIGGLGMRNEGQYILLDGKEFKPRPGEKLRGTYRITFIDAKEAVKKYGARASNGAVLVQTLTH